MYQGVAIRVSNAREVSKRVFPGNTISRSALNWRIVANRASKFEE
jgi:hypothetical protein